MKASELKKGLVLDIEGRNILIKSLDVQSPSSRSGSTLYKVRGLDLVTRQKYENRFKGDENVQTVDFGRRSVQFLFQDTDSCTFMDKENFEQYMLNTADLQEELLYLTEDLEGILAMTADIPKFFALANPSCYSTKPANEQILAQQRLRVAGLEHNEKGHSKTVIGNTRKSVNQVTLFPPERDKIC